MALQKQALTVPLRGLDTFSDPKSAAPGTLVQADNVRAVRSGRGGIELRKRFGTTSRSASSLGISPAPARHLMSYGAQELLATADTLFSWSPQEAAWNRVGTSFDMSVSLTPVMASIAGGAPTSATIADAAIGGGYALVLSDENDSVGFRYSILDVATGARVVGPIEVLSNNSRFVPRVVALATSFMIFYADASTLKARKVLFSTFAPTTATVEANFNVGSFNYDVIRNGTADSALVAVHRSGTNDVNVILWNSNMTAGASGVFANNATKAISWLQWDFSDGFAYFATCSASGVIVVRVTTANLATAFTTATYDATQTTCQQLTGWASGNVGTATVIVETLGAGGDETLSRLLRSTGGSFSFWQRGMGLWSRGFVSGANRMLVAVYTSTIQATYFVILDGVFPEVISKIAQGTAAAGGDNSNQRTAYLSSAPAFPATSDVMVPIIRKDNALSDGTAMYGTAYARLSFSAQAVSRATLLGGDLHLAGGILRAFDGVAAVELGFHLFPEAVKAANGAGGGHEVGSFGYVAVYSRVDNSGTKHESAPSTPLIFTANNTGVAITVKTYTVTESSTNNPLSAVPVTIDLYRTTASGTIYFKLASQTNDTGADTLTFTDNVLDATLVGHALLYTTGGVLPHIGPPASTMLVAWQERLFTVDQDGALWVSLQRVPGQGVAFNDALVIPLPKQDGPVTALAELDDRLVIFTATAIYVLSGAGPAPNGAGMFDQPGRINSTIGAVNQAGVFKSRDGIIFKSTRGLYLLPRGGGDPVRLRGPAAFDSQHIVGASAVTDAEEVRFVTSDGRTLVYNWGLRDEEGIGVWTTFFGAQLTAPTHLPADCINWAGGWAWLDVTGVVHQEAAALYTDDGGPIAQAIKTTWIDLPALFGSQRLYEIRILGEELSLTGSSALVYYDYNVGFSDAFSHAGTPGTGPFILRPTVGRESSLQIFLQDNSGFEGVRWTALGFEIGQRPGFQSQPSSKYRNQ